jgi:hypothetical protein
MDREIRILRLAAHIGLLATTILMPLASFAQAPPKSQTPISPKAEQLDPKACANSDTHATVGQGGNAQMPEPNGSNLSERLARSDGVICPPEHVDPEIRQPTPPGGAMPVIPPPGSPGGDRSIQPK